MCGSPQPQGKYWYIGKEYEAVSEVLDRKEHLYSNRIEIEVKDPSQYMEKKFISKLQLVLRNGMGVLLFLFFTTHLSSSNYAISFLSAARFF